MEPVRRIDPGAQAEPRRCPTCGERFPPAYLVCPLDATPLGVGPEGGDPLIGVVLAGSYRITRLLAKGGMGRLYEAEHTRLPRRFAIKVIHDQYASHPDAVARFEREARAAASIDSDHVVDVFDVIRTTDDRPCIIAERLEGEDLQIRLDRRGRLSLREAVRIARQLCRGLAAAHAVGVVHRDLKPSNVFLAASAYGQETAKILDFGVAKLVGAPDITRNGAVVGTPAYMAPEQARGAAAVDGRVDVFGVGAVLYRMLTGHAPFEAQDATASLTRLMTEPLVPPRKLVPELPEEVDDVVAAAMAYDPAQRITDPLELERALRRLDPTADPLPEDGPGSNETDLGGESAETTLVLPRGSVAGAALEARRLRRARPLALLGAAGITSATGLATGAALGAASRAILDTSALSGVAAVLVLLAAATALLGTGTGLVRALRASWPSLRATQALLRRTTRTALTGLVALGGATLLAHGLAAVTTGALPGAAVEAGLFATALLAAGATWARNRLPTP